MNQAPVASAVGIRHIAKHLRSDTAIQRLDHPVARQGKLDDRSEVEVTQIKQTAPYHHGRRLAGATREVALVDQQHPVAARAQFMVEARTVNPAAHHGHVENGFPGFALQFSRVRCNMGFQCASPTIMAETETAVE